MQQQVIEYSGYNPVNYTVRTATGLIALYLRITGFKGWTSLWNIIYMAPGYEYNARLLRHECKHLLQMQRDGKWAFMFKYTWYLLRYGYVNNPYEAEARDAEHLDVAVVAKYVS